VSASPAEFTPLLHPSVMKFAFKNWLLV